MEVRHIGRERIGKYVLDIAVVGCTIGSSIQAIGLVYAPTPKGQYRWFGVKAISESIQYAVDVVCGAAIIIASLQHNGAMAWSGFSIGAFLILLPVVGSNVAGYLAAKRGLVIGSDAESK